MEVQKWEEQMERYQTYRTLSPLPKQERKQSGKKHTLPNYYKILLFGTEWNVKWQKKITKIELSNQLWNDELSEQREVVLHKDLSEEGDGSFVGWVEQVGEEYILHLDADGKISAPEDSNYLFAFF